MKTILRCIIALIFIASGLVKAIDVVGFSFKLEEYFSPSVFNIPFLEKFALPIAVLVVALELILGIMLLLKLHLKKVLAALIALCIFFAFLTFYSAYYNKVTDCGCFGDAIKFTPWQSFIKDIILLIGLLLLWFLYRKNFEKNKTKSALRNSILVIAMVATAFVIGFGIINEPLIDFRDYKIGTDINAERLKIERNPSIYKTYYQLKNNKTNKIEEVSQDDYVNNQEYWQEGTPWQIVTGKDVSKLEKQGYDSEIVKFRLEDSTGLDVTSKILQEKNVVLLFSYQPEQAFSKIGYQKKFRDRFKEKFDKNTTSVYEISPSEKRITNFPHLFMDATAIKTIGRSNPLIVIMKKGVIVDKDAAVDYVNNK